jgi:hypothetical protein
MIEQDGSIEELFELPDIEWIVAQLICVDCCSRWSTILPRTAPHNRIECPDCHKNRGYVTDIREALSE